VSTIKRIQYVGSILGQTSIDRKHSEAFNLLGEGQEVFFNFFETPSFFRKNDLKTCYTIRQIEKDKIYHRRLDLI